MAARRPQKAPSASDPAVGFVSAAEYQQTRQTESPGRAEVDGKVAPDGGQDASPPDLPRLADPGVHGGTEAGTTAATAGAASGTPADPEPPAGPEAIAAPNPKPGKAPVTVAFPGSLDSAIRHAVEATGISSLYPPQAQALAATLDGRNALVSVPTASGKSLIAHITTLARLRARGGKALYIVPLRALASEKYEELRELCAALAAADPNSGKLHVGIATGDLDEADTRLARYDIVVTTSEKADSLMRHRAGWLREVTCAVADEIHLLGDSYRGPTLEVLLARLKALNADAQLVGLSATVGNAAEIAAWLDAELITSTWRPVALKEGIFHGNTIQFADGTALEVGGTGDAVTRLAVDAVERGGQSLVFVNTRRSTESVALRVAPKIKNLLTETDQGILKDAADRLRTEDGETSMLGSKLADAIERGSAFHNAGLSSAQRRTVETLFRQRHVKAIVATPTLAAGVNLPARRVVLRDTTRYEASVGMSVPLPVMEVKQMTGRAGRPRYDPYGEAVLIARDVDQRDALAQTYLHGEPEAIRSRLGRPAALRIHLLSGIATGMTTSRADIFAFIDSTFLRFDPAYQDRWRLEEQVDDVLTFLIEGGFIEEDGERLQATRFGQRTSDLYIDPESSLTLRDGLARVETPEAAATVSELAILTLVASTPDMPPLWLRKNDEWVEAIADEHAGRFLVDPAISARDHEMMLAHVKTAMLLIDWTEEVPMDRMEAKFSLGPGDIHNRVRSADWLLYAAEDFARMERSSLAKAVGRLRRRVHHGVREDLLRIIELEGIGRFRARSLAKAGFGTVTALKRAPVHGLVQVPGFGPRVVQRLLRQLGRDADADAMTRASAKKRRRSAGGGVTDQATAGDTVEQAADPETDPVTDEPADAGLAPDEPSGSQTSLTSFGAKRKPIRKETDDETN